MYADVNYIDTHKSHRTEWILSFRVTSLKKNWNDFQNHSKKDMIGVSDYYYIQISLL